MHPAIEALRNKYPPRAPIYQRAWSAAQREIYRAGITTRDIADASGIPLATVNRALSLRFCGKTGHHAVLAVRSAVEQLLPGITAAHWSEYDHQEGVE